MWLLSLFVAETGRERFGLKTTKGDHGDRPLSFQSMALKACPRCVRSSQLARRFACWTEAAGDGARRAEECAFAERGGGRHGFDVDEEAETAAGLHAEQEVYVDACAGRELPAEVDDRARI